jgi:hypothetical protein
MNSINESEVVNRFEIYLEDANIHTAASMIVDDCEGLSEEEIEHVLENIIVPTIMMKFAKKYADLNELYGYEHSPTEVWSTFTEFEGINETGLANIVVQAINEGAAADSDNDSDGEDSNDDWDATDWGNADVDDEVDIEDDDVVYSVDDWKNLSADERQNKVRLFLKKLARVGNDAKNMRPFLKNLNVGHKQNYLGVKYGDATKVFDRGANHYGHDANESILFPSSDGTGHDDEAQWHPLHPTLLKHGYKYHFTTPVPQPNGNVWHHNVWKKKMGQQKVHNEIV